MRRMPGTVAVLAEQLGRKSPGAVVVGVHRLPEEDDLAHAGRPRRAPRTCAEQDGAREGSARARRT